MGGDADGRPFWVLPASTVRVLPGRPGRTAAEKIHSYEETCDHPVLCSHWILPPYLQTNTVTVPPRGAKNLQSCMRTRQPHRTRTGTGGRAGGGARAAAGCARAVTRRHGFRLSPSPRSSVLTYIAYRHAHAKCHCHCHLHVHRLHRSALPSPSADPTALSREDRFLLISSGARRAGRRQAASARRLVAYSWSPGSL